MFALNAVEQKAAALIRSAREGYGRMKTPSQRADDIMAAIGSANDRLGNLEAAGEVWGALFEKLGALTKLMDGIGDVRRVRPGICYAR